jgi:broad specificity phosphatase PhoE
MSLPLGNGARTRLLLVRHGESTWNADGRWQGQADPPLSSLGEQQAAEAATRVDSIDAVWASDLARARRTAEIVAGGLGASGPGIGRLGVEVQVDPRLRERDAGEWQGYTRAEIEELWPGYLATGRRPPGYESDDALLARVLAAIDEIGAAHRGESVLVVVHGGIVRTLERHFGDDLHGLLPNLGGRWMVGDGNAGSWSLGDRVLLLEDVTVTTPEQI